MSEAKPLEEFMLPDRVDRLVQVAAQRTRNLVAVLDGVHDPHNLSATVRSCDAFGLLDLHVIESQAPLRIHRKVTQGAEKWLDIHRWPAPRDCVEALHAEGFELWLADARQDSRPIAALPWSRRMALVFGNEHRGASSAMAQAVSGRFHIPMHGFAESLNISVAVGISLALAVQGRIAELGAHGDLPADQRDELVAEWQRRSVRKSDLILEHLERTGRNGAKSLP
jgi:tRNA (guanosine-2'-O-)-methyltransferase